MADLKVHTSQNVLLEYALGNVGQRLVAALLDLLVMALYLFIANFFLSKIIGYELFKTDPSILSFFLVSLPILLYQPVIEYFWNGQTIGKYLLKLRVVRIDGTSASLGDFILRWIVRTIDVKLGFIFIFFAPSTPTSSIEETFLVFFIFFMIVPFPIVGILSMSFSKFRQRLGDRVANTVVIKKMRKFSLDDTILKTTKQDYIPTYKNVLQLSDKDIYVIKQVLENFQKTRDYKNVIEIASKAREILNISDGTKDVKLLQTLLDDYNFLGRKDKNLNQS